MHDKKRTITLNDWTFMCFTCMLRCCSSQNTSLRDRYCKEWSHIQVFIVKWIERQKSNTARHAQFVITKKGLKIKISPVRYGHELNGLNWPGARHAQKVWLKDRNSPSLVRSRAWNGLKKNELARSSTCAKNTKKRAENRSRTQITGWRK